MNQPRIVHDVTRLPTFGSGTVTPLWWANLSFMLIEGLGFVFSVATYLYFYTHNKSWPLGQEPGLLWSSLLAGTLVLSELPNVWVKRAAEARDLGKVRIGLIVMSLVAVVAIALRCMEFTTLNVRWDENAYGSILWFLLGLHTLHLITDAAETFVITVLMHIGPLDMRRFQDVEDNQDYWHFVVGWWLLIYVMLYWMPRWLEVSAW